MVTKCQRLFTIILEKDDFLRTSLKEKSYDNKLISSYLVSTYQRNIQICNYSGVT